MGAEACTFGRLVPSLPTPSHHPIKQIDGIVQDETTGVRFSSEVTVIR